MASITVKHLSKTYGGAVAVSDLSLSIASGEFVVLVGPSGCGKTTTLRMLAGFVAPDSGSVHIGERDVTRLPPRLRGIGMVFQDYALFPSMTVRQNVAFGLEEHRVPRAQIVQRVDEMLALTRMEQFADRFPHALSGGQQQRVALARALAYRPSVLLMDEPLGALDQKLREALQIELVTIQKELGITTVLVTHDQIEAMSMADRIVVMNEGQVEQVSTAAELYDTPATLFTATFIGRSNLFGGTVKMCEGGMVRLALATGEEVRARGAASSLTRGDDALCIVRPEHLHLVAAQGDDSGGNRLQAVLDRVGHLGRFAEVSGHLKDGSAVRLQLSPRDAAALTTGQVTTIKFAAEDAIIFPSGKAP